MHSNLYVGDNTHVVEVVSLQDHLGAIQTDANVQLISITDRFGNSVSGVSTPAVMPHQGAGLYRAVIPHGGAFVAGQPYKAKIKAIGSQGFRAEWTESLVAEVRAA